MASSEQIELPSSGLSDEILSRFIEKAQETVDRSAATGSDAAAEEQVHLVTFRLGKEEYGIDINSVQEIIRAIDITPVPGAPHHVRGVINLRGKIIPVVDLRRRFGLQPVEAHEDNRIVVVELGLKRLGMLVDCVCEVTKFSSRTVEEMPDEATSIEHDYIRGVAKLENRLVVCLDLKRSLLQG